MFFIPLLHLHLLIYSIYFSIHKYSTSYRPYIDPTLNFFQHSFVNSETIHHHHHHHISTVFAPPPPPPYFYCFPSTTTTTFLLFSFHHHHHHRHISIVFPQKAKEAKLRPKRPNSRRETIEMWRWRWWCGKKTIEMWRWRWWCGKKTIEMWWWWWWCRENNRNVKCNLGSILSFLICPPAAEHTLQRNMKENSRRGLKTNTKGLACLQEKAWKL